MWCLFSLPDLLAPRCLALGGDPVSSHRRLTALTLCLALSVVVPLSQSQQSSEAITFRNEGDQGCVPKGGGEGECKELFSCPSVVATFRRITPALCGFRGVSPIVCCPKPVATRNRPSFETPVGPPNVTFECGRQNGRRRPPVRGQVVGGVEATPNSWPWLAAVGRLERRGRITWFCDGILITPNFVLSAAHCASFSAVDLVRLGSHNLRTLEDSQVDVRVMDVVMHPDYHLPSNAHDLALLRLDKPVRFSRQVSPVCLPWTEQETPSLLGRSLTLAGWGTTTYGGAVSDVLMEVAVKVFPPARCDAAYSTLQDYSQRFPEGVNDYFLCAGSRTGGKDACQGDSGGPMVYNVFGRYVLAGVVTSGYGCGKADFPGIYAAVKPHLEWVREVAFSQYK